MDAPLPRPLRVMTWNVWWRFADWKRRRDAITTVLADKAPDVCGLQEVWGADDGTDGRPHDAEPAGPEDNLAAYLAAELGYHWTWAPSGGTARWRAMHDETVGFGNGLISRWPILRTRWMLLPPGDEPDEGRVVLHALLDTPGGPLPFFTTHLNANIHHSAVRCGQVAAISRFVAECMADVPGEPTLVPLGAPRQTRLPPVVCGDFNAVPGSDEIRLMGGVETAPAAPGMVFLDSWRYRQPPAPGHTWQWGNPHAAASRLPGSRIDYVFVGLPAPDGGGAVRSVEVVGDAAVGDVWPSDHAAVLVDLAP